MNDVQITSVVSINDAMPEGNWWTIDGECWRAADAPNKAVGWQWQPMNWKAFAKGTPDDDVELFPHVPFGMETV